MTSPRPQYRPTWATNAAARIMPSGGTAATGYGGNAIPTSPNWNWIWGFGGDYIGYLDDTTIRHSDMSSTAAVCRFTSTGLGFTVGGILSQRPNAGGVYMVGGYRVDLSAVDLAAPVYNFAPSATNYIWARATLYTSRSGYGDVAVTQVLVAPDTGYAHICTVTTGLLTVLSVSEPVLLLPGHVWSDLPQYFTGPVDISPTTVSRALRVYARNGTSEGALFEGETSMVNPLIRLSPQADGEGIRGNVEATGGGFSSLIAAGLDTDSVGLRAQSNGGSGAVAVLSELSGAGFDAAARTAGSPPTISPLLSGLLLSYAEASTSGAGVRWREPTAGEIRMPFVGRDGFVSQVTNGSTTAFLTSASGTFTVMTGANLTWRQNHTYLIYMACETRITVGALGFTVDIDAQVNGASIMPGGVPRTLTPLTPINVANPWLSQIFLYTHTGADVSAAARLRITHGAAGANSVSYTLPRMIVFGGWR